MDSVRRNVFDSIVDKNSHANGGRISPSDLSRAISNPSDADRYRSLFGNKLDSLSSDMKGAAGRESELYDSKLSKTLDSPSPAGPQQVTDAAFPRANPEAASASLDLLPDRGAGQRAYVESLVDKGTRKGSVTGRSIGDPIGDVVDPRAMTQEIDKAKGTVPAVLGDSGSKKLGDLMEVGRSTFSPEMTYGNPSGTAHMQQLINLVKTGATLAPSLALGHPGSLWNAAGMGSTYLGMRGAAGLVNSPSVVNWAMKPIENTKVLSKGGTILRGLSSGPEEQDQPTEKKTQDDSFIEDDVPAAKEATDDNFIEDEPANSGARVGKKKQQDVPPVGDDNFIEDDPTPKPGIPAARKFGR